MSRRNSSLTLVCFAVKEEATFFASSAGNRPELKVLITGMGRRNAEKAFKAALQKGRPDLVITAGFAGGLRPGLASGVVLFALDNAAALESALVSAGAQPGRFHCAERVAATAREKQSLWQTTGADAVEMESKVICELCRAEGIACATVRVILDPAEEDLPLDFNLLMTDDQRLDGTKLALALVKSPAKVSALLRLRKQSEAAARKLAEVLSKLVSR
jgi:adenosylhomocysteine nucleosidase